MTAIDLARGRWAPATRASYATSWADFEKFRGKSGVESLPADAGEIAAFLTARADTHSTSSLSGRLAAIVAVHELYGHVVMVKGTVIKDAWAEIRRRKGTAKKAKLALGPDDLKAIIKLMPDALVQERCIFTLALASMCRRSELVALDREDIAIFDEGMEIHIRRSKTDKTGKGEGVPVGRRADEFCPVAAMERWLSTAGIETGPVFRNRTGGRMLGRRIATITKKWGAKIGRDPAELGAHSWRSGGITALNMAGVDTKSGMLLSRHKTPAIYLGYVQPKKGLDNPAVRALQTA
jgi:integrase